MKKQKILLTLCMALTLVVGAFAQSQVTLTVTTSEGPAQIILDGKLLGVGNPTFTAKVRPGTYELIVRKPGLPDFNQRITVGGGGLAVNAKLGSSAAAPASAPAPAPAPAPASAPAPAPAPKPAPAPTPTQGPTTELTPPQPPFTQGS